MKLGLATLSAMLLVGLAAQAVGPPVETTVNTAIENFRPLWSPPTGELRNWIIGIDPAGGGRSLPRQRLRDDLSLITAAHLYYFVLKAGGSPVLTRSDDALAADPRGSAWERRIDAITQAKCNLCISILYDNTGGQITVPGKTAPRSNDVLLGNALRAALGAEPAKPVDRSPNGGGFIEALRQADVSEAVALREVCFGYSPADSTIGPALRKTCFDNARQLYTGISRFCADSANRPGSSAKPPPTDYPTSATSEQAEQLGRSIWPRGPLPEEQVDWFCHRFAQASVTNHSLVHFDVSAEHDQNAVILRGRTNVPQVISGLEQTLQSVGVDHIRNEMQTLPNRQNLGERSFGVCRVPMALTYDRPSTGGKLQTQLLFGEPLFLLDLTDDQYLLHAGDGYWGWVPREAVQPMTPEQFDEYTRHPRGVALQDIEEDRIRIPRGAGVRVMRAGENERVILLPDGSTLGVSAAAVTIHDPENSQAAARIHAALDLLYVPYVFGGCSPLGMDCSGLVTNVSARAGRKPARDAWQQALAGRLVATRWHRAGIRPGDQLFFINEFGRIYHTGLALDAVHFVHAAPPCVQIGSLDPHDRLYNAELNRAFFMAKRP